MTTTPSITVSQLPISWEERCQLEGSEGCGSGIIGGKLAGYCTKLFGIYYWPKQTSYIEISDR